MNIPILQQLEKLRAVHASSKINSATFQPDEKAQMALKYKNELKREEAKHIIEQRLRDADRKLNQSEKVRMSTEILPEVSERAQTAPVGSSSGKAGRSKSFMFSTNDTMRPSTSELSLNEEPLAFDAALKTTACGGRFSRDLQRQIECNAQDSKRIFEAMMHHYKGGGVGCQFSAKRAFEVIDISALVASQSIRPLTSSVKLEDINSLRKKDGIALLFDPCTDTGGAQVTVRVYFQKAVDLLTFENCARDYTFSGDGNYFGLQLVEDADVTKRAKDSSKPAAGLPAAGPSPHQSGEGTPTTPPDSPHSQEGLQHNGRLTASNAAGEASRAVDRAADRKVSLPGWQGRPPIFIPSTRCSLEIAGGVPLASGAAAAYNLSKLRIFAVSAASARAAVRKLHEFCNSFFVTQTANLVVTGGIPALNLAALHGNLEAVKQLVESGANINARCKESKNHTALHEAVIGGHKEVAQYLLQMGANQLLRDEIGFSPLHHACRLESIALARVLVEADSGKRALLLVNSDDQKPIELCSSNFMKQRLEAAMRKLKIFVKPRVSILQR